MIKYYFSLTLLISLFVFTPKATAQNTGGVFPPMVNEGHKSLQHRSAIDPNNSAGKLGFAQRLHYQQAINSNTMWRIIGQTHKTPSSDFDFDFVQAELFWELSDNTDLHKSGLRFDLRIRDDNRPNQLGLNWMNQFNFNDGWSARALVLSSVQTGSNAADGVNLQTRGQLARDLGNGKTLGVEVYSNFGNTSNHGNFNEQSHTAGLFFSSPISKEITVFAGPLFGLSDSAPDVEFRLWLTRGF